MYISKRDSYMNMCVILLIIYCHIELCYIVLNKEESSYHITHLGAVTNCNWKKFQTGEQESLNLCFSSIAI